MHVAFRLDSDFEVESGSGLMLPYEPEFFNAFEVSKRNSLQKDSSQPNESLFLGSIASDSSKKYGSLPQSAMPIPTRWSAADAQMSNAALIAKSIHAFTPPAQQISILDMPAQEDIPFSAAYQYKSLPRKSAIDNASVYSASPPFANLRTEVC